jgi:hypothetical protein
MNRENVNGVSMEGTIVSGAEGSLSGRGKLVHERRGIDSLETAALPEESLVVDKRCDQRPAELVESKLSRMLGGSMLPVSHLQTRGLLKQR